MFAAIKTFDELLKTGGKKFTTGDSPNIADLLIYFELTNLINYNEKFDEYKCVAQWYQEVEKIPEVNKITKEWLPLSKQLTKVLSSIKPQDEPKSSL